MKSFLNKSDEKIPTWTFFFWNCYSKKIIPLIQNKKEYLSSASVKEYLNLPTLKNRHIMHTNSYSP